MALKNAIKGLKNSPGLKSRQDQARVGEQKCRLFETIFPALFYASFLISVLLTAIIPHLGSGAPNKGIVVRENLLNWCFFLGDES